MDFVAAYLAGRALRRERRFRDRLDLVALSDNELMKKYRFPRQELILFIEEMDPHLRRMTRRSHALPTHTQVLLALRLLASGSFQDVIGDTAGKISCCMLLWYLSSPLPGFITGLFSSIVLHTHIHYSRTEIYEWVEVPLSCRRTTR